MAFQLRRGTNAQRLGLTPVEGEMIYITDSVLVSISVTSITIGTDTLNTTAAHGLSINQQIKYIGETLNGLTKNQVYFVKTAPTITTFTLSTTSGGGTVDITGTFTVDLVFAKTPTNAAGTPIGYTQSALWAGDGTTVGGLAVGITNLDALNDVVITDAAEGNFLFYDGSNWVNDNEISVDVREETLSLGRRYTTTVETYESPVALRLDGRVTDALNDNTDDAGPALRFQRSSGTEYTKTYVSGGAIGAFTVTLNNVTNLVVNNKVTGTGLPDGVGALITVIAGNQITLDTAFTVQAAGTYTIGEAIGFGQLAFEYFGTTDVHSFKVATSTDNFKEVPPNTYPNTNVLIESTKNGTSINGGELYVDKLNSRVDIDTTLRVPAITTIGGEDLAITSAGSQRITITAATGAPDPVTIERLTGNTNISTRVLTLRTESSGTPAIGLGANLEFEVETAAGVIKSGGFIETVSTNVTTGDETFQMRFGLMNDNTAATTLMTLDSLGSLTLVDDIAVNGGSITTTAGAFNLVNTSPTIVNAFGGASSAINMGNSAGLTTIAGRVSIGETLRTSSAENIETGAAIDLTKACTHFSTGSSGETATLAAGAEGQFKSLGMKGDGGGNMVVTVTNPGWNLSTGTITFSAKGDACLLHYFSGTWFAVGSTGVTFG